MDMVGVSTGDCECILFRASPARLPETLRESTITSNRSFYAMGLEARYCRIRIT
jgi:hypothetical protein